MSSKPSMQSSTSVGATQRLAAGTTRARLTPCPAGLPVCCVIARVELLGGRKNNLAAVAHQMDRQRWAGLCDDSKAILVRDDVPGGRGLEFAVGPILPKQLRIGDPAGAAADAGGLVDVEFLNHGHGDESKAAGQWVRPQIVAQQPAPLTLTDRNLSAIDAIQPMLGRAGSRILHSRRHEDWHQ